MTNDEASLQADDSVNVINPSGKLVSVAKSNLEHALESGYKESNPEIEHAYKMEEQYGGLGQQVLTGIEGAASAGTFGLSTGIEKALGVNPEDIAGRREENPIAHGAGQVAGLVGSSFIPGVGAANVLEKAGAGAAGALGIGLEGAGIASKIGAAATKGAVENALFQSGDEVSKMFSNQADPAHPVQAAITNIGLAAALGGGIGGGIGAVSPLWKATAGSKLEGVLNAVNDHAAGIKNGMPEEVNSAINSLDIQLPDEIKGALYENPKAQEAFSVLRQASTEPAQKLQSALSDVHEQMADLAIKSLGKESSELSSLGNFSNYDSGEKLGKVLNEELSERIKPIKEGYEAVASKYKNVELTPEIKDSVASKLSEAATEKGWGTSASSEEFGQVQRALKELPELKTLDDMRKWQSLLGKEFQRKQLWEFGKVFRSVVSDAEESMLDSKLGVEGAEAFEQHAMNKAAYRAESQTIDQLNDALRVGNYSGPSGFAHALADMKPETILQRLSGKNNAGLLDVLESKFPKTASTLQDLERQKLLKFAYDKALPGQKINLNALMKEVNNLSPEFRKFVVGDQAAQAISALDTVTDRLNAIPKNSSNTAPMLEKMFQYVPGAAVGLVTMATGHNPAIAFLAGGLTKYLGRDVPDAMRLSLLKYMGSGGATAAVDSAGFKAMFDFIATTMKAENTIGKAAGSLFKSGREVLPSNLIPSTRDVEKLDKRLKELQENPEELINSGGDVGSYLPDHAQALGQTASNAANILNSMRPTPAKMSPLDSEPEVSAGEKAAFERALMIGQQPLMALKHIKDGTLLPQDVTLVKTLYPALYEKISQKMMDGIADSAHKKEQIPYDTRLGISLFLGQPLDSTMTPAGMMALQTKLPSQPMTQGQGPHSMKGLGDLSKSYLTPQQARTKRQASR